jgi:hypothetical protein
MPCPDHPQWRGGREDCLLCQLAEIRAEADTHTAQFTALREKIDAWLARGGSDDGRRTLTSLERELVAALRQLMQAYAQVLPGIGHCANVDLSLINDAPIAAAKAIQHAEGIGQ